MSEQAGCGGGKQQHAGLLRLEDFGRVLRGPERAVQIDRQCFAPALRGNVLGGAGRPADSGVGANDVQSAICAFAAAKNAPTSSSRETSARAARESGWAAEKSSSAFWSTSQTATRAPERKNASAIARPIPAAPAVMSARTPALTPAAAGARGRRRFPAGTARLNRPARRPPQCRCPRRVRRPARRLFPGARRPRPGRRCRR